jgi:hypothetical protein
MAEVNVNIRGRDDGLGSQLDALRQKVQQLGRDVTDLNRLSEMTPTEQKVTVEREAKGALRAKQEQVKSEYAEVRQSNLAEFKEQEEKFSRGEISKKEFKKQKELFEGAQSEATSQEQKELAEIEKEMNMHLRLIVREMVDKRKLDRERSQRDKKEFEEGGKGGLYGTLVQENKDLQKQRLTAQSQEDLDDINARIAANKERMREMDGGGARGGKGGEDGTGINYSQLAQSIASANLAATSIQTGRAAGGLLGGSKGATATASVIAAAYALLSQSDQVYAAGQGVGSLRGSGYSGSTQMFSLIDQAQGNYGTGMATSMGLNPQDFLKAAEIKGRETGIAGPDILRRTLEDLQFNKAFGADAGIFNSFERFTTQQREATDISLDVLNVLTSINESSLKEGDLATLTEKLQTQQTLMSIQRTKRDIVDVDSSLRMLAAFESIGLSQKGEKSGDFLAQTIQGLGEGGGDNLMLMKYEAAKRAHPDLAYNPAELRRFVRFNSDDPKYIEQFMKMSGDWTQGNQMARDDLLYSFFNPQSEYDMELYERAMTSGDFSGYMTGKKPIQKGRKGTLSKEFAASEASTMNSAMSEMLSGFQSIIGTISTSLENWLTNNTVKVNVTNSYGNLPVSPTTKGVRKNGSK